MTYPLKPGTKVKLTPFAKQYRDGAVLDWVGLVVNSKTNWTCVKWPGYQETTNTDGEPGMRFRIWTEPTDYLEKTLEPLSPTMPLDKAVALTCLASNAHFSAPRPALGRPKKIWNGKAHISRLQDIPI